LAQQTLNLPRESTHQRIADTLEDIVDKIVDTSSASNIDYDNTQSGLSADKVQGAVDELALAGFVTNTVNNLVNYYLKSETYNKTEVDSLITAVKNSRFEVVSTLPTTDIKTNVIYLVPKLPTQTSNAKDEYINLDGTSSGWEKIGDTEVDLSGYVTTNALNTALSNYTTTANLTNLLDNKVDKVEGKGLSTNDYTDADKNKLAGIEAEANKTVVDSVMSDRSTNPLQNRVITGAFDGKTDVNNFNALTQEIELFNTYDLTNDVEIPVFANDTYKRDKYDRSYETHIPNIDGEYSVSLGDKTFTETCTFTIANQGTSITETFHTNRKYILGAKLLKAENDEVGFAHVIADVVTLTISKDAPYTTTFDKYLEHPPVTGVLTLKVSVKPDEKYVNKENTGGPSEYAYWGSYNGSDLLINNPILTYSETTFGQPKVSGNPITIKDASNTNLVECVAKVEAVQEGSGDPSPTNIRPISGWDEVNVSVVGKNLAEFENNGFDVNGNDTTNTNRVRSVGYQRVVEGDYYTVSASTTVSGKTVQSNVFFFNDNDHSQYIAQTSWNNPNTFQVPNGIKYVRVLVRYSDDTNINVNDLQIQLEKNTTATTYEPYKGKTYTIQLGDTIYGGELDVIIGELTVTHEMYDMPSTSWMINTNNQTCWVLSHPAPNSINVTNQDTEVRIITDFLKGVTAKAIVDTAVTTGYENTIAIISNSRYLAKVEKSIFATKEDFMAYISANSSKVVYELATPYTIKLTPQQIKLLKGTNNISCNTGDLSIKYYPDNVLGQLKGDIESEYDAIIQNLLERIEALENQQ
jgi:hypothetical protein